VFVKNLSHCNEFIANDGCQIKEWLHPDNEDIDLPYSIAVANIEESKSSYKHILKQDEVYLIQQGKGIMHINDDSHEVISGDAIFIPANSIQWIENSGNTKLIFLALVSPPWKEVDDIRL
jgi:mannose-6-phosphate isomerase-like protein (cupin superfamily)